MKARATMIVEIEVELHNLSVSALAEDEIRQAALKRLNERMVILDVKGGLSGDNGFVNFVDANTACIAYYSEDN